MPGVTPEQLLDTARRAKVASADMTAEGTRLTYLSAILLSRDIPTACSAGPPSRRSDWSATGPGSHTSGSSPQCTWPGRPPMTVTAPRFAATKSDLSRSVTSNKSADQKETTRGEFMSPQMPAGTGQLTSSRQSPVTRHSPTASAGARRLARGIGGTPARAAFVIMIALLAGCSSSATPSPKATSTQSAPAAASTPAAPRTFTSRHYGYTGALPAGWSSDTQATQQWNGQGAPGDEDSVVDLFSGPGGVEAWAMAAPTKQSLAAYTTATTRACRRRASVPGDPANRPGHHDRRRTRPAAESCSARRGAASWWRSRPPSMMGPPTCSHPRTRPAAAIKTLIAPLSAHSWPVSGFSREGPAGRIGARTREIQPGPPG